MPDAPPLVVLLWVLLLLVSVLVVLPVLVYLLHRTLNAARQIESYAARAAEAGVGIAGNTADIAALDTTIEHAGRVLPLARALDEHSGDLESILSARAGR